MKFVTKVTIFNPKERYDFFLEINFLNVIIFYFWPKIRFFIKLKKFGGYDPSGLP